MKSVKKCPPKREFYNEPYKRVRLRVNDLQNVRHKESLTFVNDVSNKIVDRKIYNEIGSLNRFQFE